MADERHLKRKERSRTVLVIPCLDEELHAILDTLFANGVIKPVQPEKPPSREDKKNPRYCRYHQIVGHPTPTCQTLRKILPAKIDEGTLELPSKKQAIDDPFSKRHGNGVCTIITGVDKMGQGEENVYGTLALSVYQSLIDQAACRGRITGKELGKAAPPVQEESWDDGRPFETGVAVCGGRTAADDAGVSDGSRKVQERGERRKRKEMSFSHTRSNLIPVSAGTRRLL
ncbi:hypothetical protein ACLB2K_047382 [Fragaria x ananassa]